MKNIYLSCFNNVVYHYLLFRFFIIMLCHEHFTLYSVTYIYYLLSHELPLNHVQWDEPDIRLLRRVRRAGGASLKICKSCMQVKYATGVPDLQKLIGRVSSMDVRILVFDSAIILHFISCIVASYFLVNMTIVVSCSFIRFINLLHSLCMFLNSFRN